MTALFYISYSSRLSEADKLAIDKSVLENRLTVKKFVKKVYGKGKVVVVSAALGLVIVFYRREDADAMSLTPMSQATMTPIMRINNRIRSTKVVRSNARLDLSKEDEIIFVKSRELPLCIYLMDDQFLVNPKVSKLIKKHRGGSWTTTLIVNVILLSLLYGIRIIGKGAQGFVPDAANPVWGLNRPNPFQPPSRPPRFPPYYEFLPSGTPGSPSRGSTLKVLRPSAVPHQDFVSMLKEDRRQLPHPNDMRIQYEGHPKLRVGFWQGKFKVGDHGAVHGLPFSIKDNGGTKTEKTDENALKMMRSIVDMPNRKNVM